MRNQPAPPHVIFEALTDPDRDPSRPWLDLLEDEQRPMVLTAEPPSLLVWSSLWTKRADAVIRFELAPGGGGTDLSWILYVAHDRPSDALIGHMRKRLNQLLNANLRYTFGH